MVLINKLHFCKKYPTQTNIEGSLCDPDFLLYIYNHEIYGEEKYIQKTTIRQKKFPKVGNRT